MNKVQFQVICLLREIFDTSSDPIDETLKTLDDAELARRIFYSYRGGELDGCDNMRLTKWGFDVLRTGYAVHEIDIHTDYRITAGDLLFLRGRCTLPYHIEIEKKKLWFFETELAVMARLVDGQISLIC